MFVPLDKKQLGDQISEEISSPQYQSSLRQNLGLENLKQVLFRVMLNLQDGLRMRQEDSLKEIRDSTGKELGGNICQEHQCIHVCMFT